MSFEVSTSRGPLASVTSAETGEEEDGVLAGLKKRFDISRQIDETYASLKRRLGVGPHEVVYFVPLLFVAVFLTRCLADFVSGYAFQHIGLGVTTDIRNDLYWHILRQSSRFHAEHPSGELDLGRQRALRDEGGPQTCSRSSSFGTTRPRWLTR